VSPESHPRIALSRPLRLALCITELEAGGAERCLTELALRLDRRRFEPIVYSLGPEPMDPQRSMVPRLAAGGVSTVFLNGRGARDAWRVARALRKQFQAQRPDVLQTFLFHANVLGRLAGRWADVPTIVSGIRVAERRGRGYLWIDRMTARWVDVHVCVSQSVAEFSRDQAGLPADRLEVIPNGVDLARFEDAAPVDAQQLGLRPGRRWVTFVGRLDRQKRIDWLLREASGWLTSAPQHDLLLVGDGPDREALVALARSLGLAERVCFMGWRSDVAAIFAASDLLVLPSAWEGMPNVLLEAMASGLPVVATQAEGVVELLGPLAELQSVRLDDARGFSERVAALLTDLEGAKELGARNRGRVSKEFSLDRMVERYSTLYERLARRNEEALRKRGQAL
jgi:glycosyltransferase involved in cell wall biosynthesis